MTTPEQVAGSLTLFDIADDVVCVRCDQPIDTTTNHVPDPPQHVRCHFRHQQQTAPPSSSTDPAVAAAVRQLQATGCIITGPYRGDHATRHSEDRPPRGGWDHPGAAHLPWVVIHQTPCLRDDLGRDDPPTATRGATATHWCRRGHLHTGSRADIPGAPQISGGTP